LFSLGACGGSSEPNSNDIQEQGGGGDAALDFSGSYCLYGFNGPQPVDMQVSRQGEGYEVSLPIYISRSSPSFQLNGVFSGVASAMGNSIVISGQVDSGSESEPSEMDLEFALNEEGGLAGGAWSLPNEGLSGDLTGDFAPCSAVQTFDVSQEALPRFAASNYIQLSAIDQISQFRSGIGHDYSDGFESCRSMKHYFRQYYQGLSIPIYSPVGGRIVSMLSEQTYGEQVWIQSDDYPAFFFGIFHVNPEGLSIGQHLAAGEQMSTHIGDQTNSDIAVGVNDPQGWRLVSFFEVMTDEVFGEFAARGVASREEMIISASQRDSHPLICNGETFVGADPIPNTLITLAP